MANYVKITNFSSKDALLSGNPAKVVKGSEIDAEFNALATSISSKADTASPIFTGTPVAPTAVANTNNTQVATTAFVYNTLPLLYPVGVLFASTSSINPGTSLGFGTWTAFTGATYANIQAGVTIYMWTRTA
jgi:hypothetical protein